MNTKTKLIRDPVTRVWYIDNRFKQILNILTNKNSLFKDNFVVDYFCQLEFQARGSVHIHILLYCNNAPSYDENNVESERNVIEFIDNIITCKYDPTNPYMTFQRHKHKPTCYKGKKSNLNCRFHYPLYVMPKK